MYKKVFALVCTLALTLSSVIVTANATTKQQNVPSSANVQTLNNFGLKLYNKLYSDTENVFVSPISVYLALSMVTNGASGNTQTQLINSLYPKNKLSNINTMNKNLQSYITKNRTDTTINIANSIWIRNNFFNSVKKKFLNTNKSYYNATVSGLNFSDKSATDTINNWVSKNTNGLINEVIDGQISPDVMMYLINSVYFKADWMNEFNKSSTVKSDFTTPQGKVSIDMMNIKKFFNYYENNLLQMVSLPYKDGKTSMLVILPKGNLSSIKNSLSPKNLNQWIKSMKSSEVMLSLPKVNAEYKEGLKTALSSLGMSDMFNKDKASFKNISSEKLYVSDLLHNTVLKMDELGTEAAAVTSVEFATTSMPIEPPKVMDVNKPFVSIIYDNSTGLILFEGSITNPQ